MCGGSPLLPQGEMGRIWITTMRKGREKGKVKSREKEERTGTNEGLCTPQKDRPQHWGRAQPMPSPEASHGQGLHSRHDPASCPCQRGQQHQTYSTGHLHAVLLCVLGAVSAVEELPLEELHGDDGEDEHEELVDNEDVEDVLEGRHHAVKNGLKGRAGLTLGNLQPWKRAGPRPGYLLGKELGLLPGQKLFCEAG